MKRSRRALLLALFSLAIASGCGEENECPLCPIGPPSRGSPEDLLTEYFERAYQSQDSILYDEMLHADFRFHFLPGDADSLRLAGILIPGLDAWGRVADVASTGAMFRSPKIGAIALQIVVDSIASPDTSCAGCQRVETNVVLRVTTRPDDPDPIILSVDSKQTFVVAKNPADDTKWVVVRQYDSDLPGTGARPLPGQGGPASTEPSTWGSIKGLYFNTGEANVRILGGNESS